jgi:hypothetical protein
MDVRLDQRGSDQRTGRVEGLRGRFASGDRDDPPAAYADVSPGAVFGAADPRTAYEQVEQN